MIKELVVISGKGGTGKTSLTGSFAVLANQPVISDCDVDAADLHLLLEPKIVQRRRFIAGQRAQIRPGHCTACGKCEELCRFDAIFYDGPGNGSVDKTFRVDPIACEGCGVCARFCAEDAIVLQPTESGEWYISQTRCGTMVHAQLGIGAANSGRLVTLIRKEAARLAEQENSSLILIDGPPGIGCPVIASVTGANVALVVTEPTVSGEHDLERVLALTRHFDIDTAVCVNKWDINPEMTERIESSARQWGARIAGRVRYDTSLTSAQMQEKTAIETHAPCADDIIGVWNNLNL
ncbi:MAG TPA: ATP-binding protein [bacterium]|nr:ATP-binding protein [bacterium]